MTMSKAQQIGVRLTPHVKLALEKAAEAELRTVANLSEKILIEWLVLWKWLPESPKNKSPK